MTSRPIKVMLVEDDEGDYVIVRDRLASAGDQAFDLKWFDRLDPALRYLAEGQVDVILLDLSIADTDGLETFNLVRLRAPHLPIIMLTRVFDEAGSVRAVKEGAQDYLVKGEIRGDQLLRAIRYAIERKRSQETLVRYREHLKELVAERTSELEKVSRSLRREVLERKAAEDKLRDLVKRTEEDNEARSRFVSNV